METIANNAVLKQQLNILVNRKISTTVMSVGQIWNQLAISLA